MARTNFIVLTTAEEALFYKALNSGDRFTFAKINRKVIKYSKKSVKGLTARSLLPVISEAWATLTDLQKIAWSNAGAEMGLNGWRLFVQDHSARIKNEIAGIATPSTLHQSWVGYIEILDPATEAKLVQLHPNAYWVSQKVPGHKGMYEPVKIVETFSLPLTLNINYKSNLVSTGAGSYAKFYARIKSSYQGVDRYTNLEIPFDLITDWKAATTNISSVIGQLASYNLFIELYNLQGDLYFDNVKATHDGQNWVRDTYCKDPNQAFTRAFYQIPKNWAAEILPAGAEFGSFYPG